MLDFKANSDPFIVDGIRASEARNGSCAILGPSQSGKTTLLLAMQQACLQTGQNRRAQEGEAPYEQKVGDGYKLDFVPESESTSSLVSLAGEFLFRGKTVQASREITDYSFRIYLNDLEKPGPEISRHITVTDGPGGYLFPGEGGWQNEKSPAWRDLLERARNAQDLVLCVDASDPGVDMLYHGLPDLILHLKGDAPRLHYRRVLLLTTKIDRLIDNFQKGMQKDRPSYPWPYPQSTLRWNGVRIARLLDPIAQARQLLGKVIEILQGSLASNARLAVGLCSALGFDHDTGSSFVSTLQNEVYDPSTVATRLRDWEPFGVREAILFLMAGEIQHPVAEIHKATSAINSKSWNVRVPTYV